jgi:hypothetical protein
MIISVEVHHAVHSKLAGRVAAESEGFGQKNHFQPPLSS